MTTDLVCQACGESNPERARFCLACGRPLGAAPESGSPESGSHESRRTVTVVFADMVGFTRLGERLDEESLRRVMDGFYAEMRQAIEGQSGTLAKFIGDAVLAVWGTPEVREDDAIRAVRAAEAMRRSLATLNEGLDTRWGVRVGMRTGVNTGEVVVDPARPADLLVGDTLNVAARLEQAADDGEILIGPQTQQLVRDHAVLEAVEPLTLKGKSQPMPAWRVVDGSRADSRATPRIEAPLVGRDTELTRLREHFDDTVAGRSCRLVTVIGSPGLGKTRLVAELVRSVRNQATVLQGRCEATGKGITFQPVAEVIRQAAGIEEDDAPDAARAKIEFALPSDEPDRQRLADRVAALLGLGPATSTEETFWAVRRLLEGIARERPVLLVFEDIHWGQPTFLDLVDHLAQWVGEVPLLIVALARPELREARPGLAEPSDGGGVRDMVALEPLLAGDSRTLVERLLGDSELPPALAERVLETTEGNPLFLGEMLRMLADDGVLRREGDTWVAAGDAANVTVPPTIQALLAARIERLGADERSVVERASVIGHQFYRGAVAELTPPPAQPAVDGALVTLQRKELVRPEEALWLDERVFRFHHVLIRDAAYRSLLKEARADLHERFAAWLERKAGEVAGEVEEVIAFHLEQAHLYRLELGPLDERGRALAGNAATRLHSAGSRAIEREDLPAAINLLGRALAPLLEEERAPVRVDLAEALLSSGDTAAAEEIVEALGLGADQAGDERLGAWATVFAGQLDNLTGAGRVRETVEAASEAAEILAREGDGRGEAKAHHVVAQAEALLGRVAAAEVALDRALVAARAVGDQRRVTAVLSGAPRAALWGPAPIVRASGRCLDVVRILRMTPGTRHVEAAALRCQAVLEAMRGRGDAARTILDGCRATFEELGLALELHETAVHAGIVALLGGDPAAAEGELRRAQDGFLALGVDSGAAQAGALLARALLEEGRDDEALEATRFAEQRGGEDLKTTIAWLGVRAEALARSGETGEALALAERAARLAEPTDALADKADALMALARVRAAAGEAAGARAAAEDARALYAEKDHAVGVESAAALAGSEAASEPAPSARRGQSLDSALEETAAGRVYLEIRRTHNRRDWDAFARAIHDDFVHVEHRRLGWDVHNAEQLTEVNRSWSAMAPDSYMTEFRIVAQSEHVLAFVYGGRGTVDGAQVELALGSVMEELEGRLVRQEAFEVDDIDGMMRCFHERVCARQLEETAAGRTYLAYMRAYDERDWEALRGTFDGDCVVFDHRRVGVWDVEDADGLAATMREFAELAPDSRLYFQRILAQAEHVVAGVVVGRGTRDGVEWELGFGVVFEERDGRFARLEGHEPGDREGIMLRFEQISRERELETTPVGRLYLDQMRASDERDWEAVRALFHDDCAFQAHVRVGAWDLQDADGLVATMKGFVDMSPDSRRLSLRIEAQHEHVLAGVITNGGTVDGADWQMAIGFVCEERDGRFARMEGFEPEDSEGILRRFDEVVRYRELETTRAGRSHLAFLKAFNARDWDALRSLYSDDYVVIDHRHVGDWDAPGAEKFIENMRGWAELAPDGRVACIRLDALSEESVAGVMAGRGTVDGAEFELAFGFVLEQRGGLTVRTEMFEPDDRDAIMRRFEEAVRYRELEGTHVGRAHAAFLRAFNERDWDAVRSLYSDDYVVIDHRRVGDWDAHSAEKNVEDMQGWAELAPDGRVFSLRIDAQTDELLAGVMAGRGTVDGTEFELAFGFVLEHRDGLNVRMDMFDPDDRDAILACFERVQARGRSGYDTLATRAVQRYVDAMGSRDWDALRECFTPGFRLVDTRQLGWVEQDHDAMVATGMSAAEGGTLKGRVRWLAANDSAAAYVITWYGKSDEGMEWELPLCVVNVVNGAVAYGELFDPDDEAGALARFEELTASSLRPVHPLARLSNERLVRCFNERRWEELRASTAADFVGRDLRVIAGREFNGPGGLESIWTGIVDVGPGSRMSAELLAGELLPDGSLLSAAITTHHAPLQDSGDGGLLFEVRTGTVRVSRDGVLLRTDVLEDDPDAILAHYDELRAATPPG